MTAFLDCELHKCKEKVDSYVSLEHSPHLVPLHDKRVSETEMGTDDDFSFPQNDVGYVTGSDGPQSLKDCIWIAGVTGIIITFGASN